MFVKPRRYKIKPVKVLPLAVAVLAGALLYPLTTVGAGKSKKKSTPVPEPSDKITAIYLTSITINTYTTHAAREFKVTPATKITVNGTLSQLTGLATGMDVVVTPASDGITAARIEAKTRTR